MTELEKKILQRIRDIGGGVSFAELHSIEGFAGNLMFGHRKKNIWYWFWCSQEAVEALTHLLKTDLIEISRTSPFDYNLDRNVEGYGKLREMPIFKGHLVCKGTRMYETPHWQPVVLSPLLSQEDYDDD